MLNAILSRTDLLMLPLVGLAIFTALFAGTLVLVFLPGAREAGAARSRLVFTADEEASRE